MPADDRGSRPRGREGQRARRRPRSGRAPCSTGLVDVERGARPSPIRRPVPPRPRGTRHARSGLAFPEAPTDQEERAHMAATEPGKIRNVAVVGHRGTGKTSLVEALLFQTGEVNRLGTIEAGTTVSDSDEDEQRRAVSISLSLTHTEWQGRKINLARLSRRSVLPGRGALRAPRRRGRARRRLGRHGLRGRDRARQEARRGARARPRARRQHARPRARRLLPDARADPGAVLLEVRRRPHPDRRGARARGDRRRPPHVRVHEPERAEGGRPGRDPRLDGRARAGVPREAARRGRPDRRGADGALPRGRGARRARRRRRAQARRHARRDLPGRVLGRDEEPRHARAARPARRGRSVAGEARRAVRRRRSEHRRVRLQDGRRPVRREDQPLPRAEGRGHERDDAPRPPRPLEGADGLAPRAPGQDDDAGQGVRRGRPRRRREAQGRPDGRPPHRQGGRGRAAGLRLPRARDELRRDAEDQGRGGEGRHRDQAARRGGPDPAPSPRPADRARRSSPG